MAIESLNHINIAAPAELLARVRDFYVDIVGLTEGDRPDFGIAGYWLYGGGAPIVHMLARENASPASNTGYLDHVAFTCSDLESTEKRLDELGVAYRRNDFSDRGFIQLFLQDPTGLGVELNFQTGS